MTSYEEQAYIQLEFWQHRMQKKPSLGNRIAKGVQNKINNIIPEKVHSAITIAIEKMVKGVLFGARYVTKAPLNDTSLQMREVQVKEQIEFYKRTASVEGAVTGAGGILMGLADFPILIGIKIKLLFEIAALYGYDVHDYKERLYILYIFQLAFSSQQGRNEVYQKLAAWQGYSQSLPDDENEFDWRAFQQEYRDYIDLAKMAQLIPFIGAAVGAVVNYRLLNQLGETAMNCYRMRKVSPLKILTYPTP
ncbi:EcsC family protein [Mucilaginibacter sp. JRF]|uniref:EcsC family protein n=1 Tax=Mucilaginibacter sp. JRF TaxID=2780088 RepID=UPI00187ED67B|nr:EcsC family protein [Mucilaginibacter sp. JRF]MBE9585465.1 EcsC family protein [Mucilaginibacter sp. JRF]